MSKTLHHTKKYEEVNSPSHYNIYPMEVIEMMQKIWGTEATMLFCEMSAFKYRMRLGIKPEINIQTDLKKEQWYLTMAKALKKPDTWTHNINIKK